MNARPDVSRYSLPLALALALAASALPLQGQVQAPAAGAPRKPATVLRLWDLECGEIHSIDQSQWTPDRNVGKAVDLSDNCYVILHPTRGLFLWDTGMADSVVAKPTGQHVLDLIRREADRRELGEERLRAREHHSATLTISDKIPKRTPIE